MLFNIWSAMVLIDAVFVCVYKHHGPLNSLHFVVNSWFLGHFLWFFLGELFLREEGPFEELLWNFDIVLVFLKRGIWMLKIEEQLITSPIENTNDLAVLHNSDNCAVLEDTLDRLIVIGSKVAKVFYLHFFVDRVCSAGHQIALCYLFMFTLELSCRFIRIIGVSKWLLKYNKRRCKHLLRIVCLTIFFIGVDAMDNKRNCITCEVSEGNIVC